jgi:anti-sigma factor RsiW
VTKFHAPHPAEEQLLRFVDGELPPKQAAAVRSHLEACWNCRTQLEEFQKGISDYVRYHEALKAEVPLPPRPWADLRRRMEEQDRALATTAVRRLRLARLVQSWLPAAAAVVLACLALYRFGTTPKASAAVLLQKAVAAERSIAGERHIRVRTRARAFTRSAVYVRNPAASSDSLAVLFASANYSWDQPLSARAYASWRDQLSNKSDEVETVRGGYLIRTTTPAGSLAEATITLRAQDFAPVSGTFQFRGSEWVEITEATAPAPQPEPAAPAHEVARALPAAMPAPMISAPAAPGPSEELEALADDINSEGYFHNSDIMYEVLNCLHEIAEQGELYCQCGNLKIEVELFPDCLELHCRNCDSINIIYAETEDDLNVIRQVDTIELARHGFKCLDSLANTSKPKKTRRKRSKT